MDIKPSMLTTLRHCERRLHALERAHCDRGPTPIPSFPCLGPLIAEIRDILRLLARRRALVPRRR